MPAARHGHSPKRDTRRGALSPPALETDFSRVRIMAPTQNGLVKETYKATHTRTNRRDDSFPERDNRQHGCIILPPPAFPPPALLPPPRGTNLSADRNRPDARHGNSPKRDTRRKGSLPRPRGTDVSRDRDMALARNGQSSPNRDNRQHRGIILSEPVLTQSHRGAEFSGHCDVPAARHGHSPKRDTRRQAPSNSSARVEHDSGARGEFRSARSRSPRRIPGSRREPEFDKPLSMKPEPSKSGGAGKGGRDETRKDTILRPTTRSDEPRKDVHPTNGRDDDTHGSHRSRSRSPQRHRPLLPSRNGGDGGRGTGNERSPHRSQRDAPRKQSRSRERNSQRDRHPAKSPHNTAAAGRGVSHTAGHGRHTMGGGGRSDNEGGRSDRRDDRGRESGGGKGSVGSDSWHGTVARESRSDTSRDRASERHSRRDSPRARRDSSHEQPRRGGQAHKHSSLQDASVLGESLDIARIEDAHISAENVLTLLKQHGKRMSLAHASAAFERLAKIGETRKNSRTCDEALELLAEVSITLESSFDLQFCRHVISSLKKLKSKSVSRASLLQAVSDHMFKLLDMCEAADVSSLFVLTFELQTTQPASFWQACTVRHEELLNDYTLQQMAETMCWASKIQAAKLQVDHSFVNLIETLSERVVHLMQKPNYEKSNLEPDIFSNIMCAFATIHQAIPLQLFDIILVELPKAEKWKAHQISTIIWSVAVLKINLDQSVFDFLARQMTSGLCSPQDISNTFWGYATLQKVPDSNLVEVLTQRAIDTMRDFSAQQLSNLFLAFALLSNLCQPGTRLLSSALEVRMYERAACIPVDKFGSQEVSSIMWSVTTLHKDGNGVIGKMRPERGRDIMLRMVRLLPKLAAKATPEFLAQTLHAMAETQIWNQGFTEDDTTHVRRKSEGSSRDRLRNHDALEKDKIDVVQSYSARALEVINDPRLEAIHKFDGMHMKRVRWALRTLAVECADLLAAMSRHARDIVCLDVVDIMWTNAVLWTKPDPDVLTALAKKVDLGIETWSTICVTRFLWALSVVFVQEAQGVTNWQSVLNKLARFLLQHEDSLDTVTLKQLHQFFLTCITCTALGNMLPDSILDVKEKLEQKCILHVREASASQHLEHTGGQGCAAQLRKLGLLVECEQECPNTGFNLDMLLTASTHAPPHLQPPIIDGLRGWVLEIDRPSHYLAGSRTLKEGRCRLREKQLEGVGYVCIVLPYWEWTDVLQRPDHELQAYLAGKVAAAFTAAGKSSEH